MGERLMGLETEYAVTALSWRGEPIDRRPILQRFIGLARDRYACLPDGGGGLFLENGARFYVDCGNHPEISTPECTDPRELVRYTRAGDRMMVELAQAVERDRGYGSQVMVFRNNVDYSGSRTTWGSHESHLHTSDPTGMPAHLVGHLVTRVVFAGAGGWNPFSPGLEFVVSPRSFYIDKVVSHDSTSARGIFHTRDESLSKRGCHRLHLLCGESLASETALWLRVGTTALIVAMYDKGRQAGPEAQLKDPRAALRIIAQDPLCRAPLALVNGEVATATQVQRRYLAMVRAASSSSLPTWAPAVCDLWQRTLDALESDPEQLVSSLDWPLKQVLYRKHVLGKGLTWESLSHWTYVVTRLSGALTVRGSAPPLTVDAVLGPQSVVKADVDELTPYLRRHGLTWDGLGPFLSVRRQLLEVDTRFGQLGRGIFDDLDARGVLHHRVIETAAVENAMHQPPSASRARLRGELVRRYAAQGGMRAAGGWQAIWNPGERKVFDLSDPFESQERWRPMTEEEVCAFQPPASE